MKLAEELRTNEYIRQRLSPRPADPDYLCLSDLLQAVRELAPLDARKIMDYGCGGSPYRSLFSSPTYHRADLAGGDALDFEFDAESRLPPDIGGYDFVLSSQVLEHVLDVDLYLAECYRILEPGGRLLVTTHGTFNDHACPHDYWRWTGFGLINAIEKAGFRYIDGRKLTTGVRATLFLLQNVWSARFKGGWRADLLNWALRYLRGFGNERFQTMVDVSFPANRAVPIKGIGENADHSLYLVIAVLAEKPR